MMKDRKYIVLDGDTPVLFPATMNHADVAYKFGKDRVTSAGFWDVSITSDGDKKFHCWGKSFSLSIESNPEKDSQLLTMFFGDSGW